MKEKLLSTMFTILFSVLEKMTPDLKSVLSTFLDELEAKAKKTPNPFDDFGVKILKGLFG